MLNSFEDLNTRFAQVASQPHAVTRKSAGAVGELFEQLMVGGVVGNDRGADFAAINTEAKVHHGKGVLTVFTFAPTDDEIEQTGVDAQDNGLEESDSSAQKKSPLPAVALLGLGAAGLFALSKRK